MTIQGKAICRVCGAPNFGQNYCQKHWRAAIKAGTITTASHEQPCAAPGCDRGQHCKGFCRRHYDQWLLGKDLTPIPNTPRPPRGCDFPDCERKHHGRGWCKEHLRQAERGRGMYPIGEHPLISRSTTPRMARPKPAPVKPTSKQTQKPARRRAKSSILPPGWDKPMKRREYASTPGTGGVAELPPAYVFVVPPEVQAAAWERIAGQPDAAMLAAMLGLSAGERAA